MADAMTMLKRYLQYHMYNKVHFSSFRTLALPMFRPYFKKKPTTYDGYKKDIDALVFPNKLAKGNRSKVFDQVHTYSVFLNKVEKSLKFLAQYCDNDSPTAKSILESMHSLAEKDHEYIINTKNNLPISNPDSEDAFSYAKERCKGMFGN